MDLTIHHNFGSLKASYDTFSNVLYTAISSLSKVNKVNKKHYNLETSSSKALTVKNSGEFTVVTEDKEVLIKTGTIDELSVERSNNYLNTKGFDILTATNANLPIHQFLMCGYSNRSARSIVKNLLNKDDSITGSKGDDFLCGYRGDDTIYGGHGADVLYGGKGKDNFVYESIQDSGVFASKTINGSLHAGGNSYTSAVFNDVILDFRSGRDKIDLTKLNLTSKKCLSITASTFYATDSRDQTSYSLWVDQDIDGNPDMIIEFSDTQKKLELSDVLI